ncbi:MAG: ATP synthase F0 subunit A [Cryomorphaceae bacterium]|nr:MAG: ATP synthase F0 subunit A [Cryomorphaceae bacterium]
MKSVRYNILTWSFLAVFAALLPFQNVQAGGGDGPFNAGEMIMHHIADAHEIHIIGDFAIYLPVILFTDNGVEMFSSSNFYHNQQKQVVNGVEETFYEHGNFIMHHEKIYYRGATSAIEGVEDGHLTNASPLDFSITKSVFGMFLVIALLLVFFGGAARKYQRNPGQAPSGLQNALEPFILFIRDEVARPSIGRHADRFVPFLLTTFFFIWISNMLGLIPFIGGFNITGTLAVTAVLAFFVLVLTTINGNKHYWGHIFWPPGVPLPIKFILVPIEAAQILIKPFVLMVRLTANITAGHIIILAFVSLALIFGEKGAAAGYGVGVGGVLFMVFMFFLELLVAFLQAYVFTLLAALYFGDATQEAHH